MRTKKVGIWNRGGASLLEARRAKYAAARQAQYAAIPRGVMYRQPQQRIITKRYVNRSPGGQITAENHYFESTFSSTIVSVTTSWTGTEVDPGTLNCLFAPTQGDDNSQRTGRKAFVKALRFRGRFTVPAQTAQAATPDAALVIRLIVYMDKQTNGAQNAAQNVISGDAASAALEMFQSRANFGRFKILKDKTFTLQNPTIAGITGSYEQSSLVREFKMTCKPNMWINYNATNGGTVADTVDNSFHVICNCSSTALVPSLQYRCRTVFSP